MDYKQSMSSCFDMSRSMCILTTCTYHFLFLICFVSIAYCYQVKLFSIVISEVFYSMHA